MPRDLYDSAGRHVGDYRQQVRGDGFGHSGIEHVAQPEFDLSRTEIIDPGWTGFGFHDPARTDHARTDHAAKPGSDADPCAGKCLAWDYGSTDLV